ncbi:DegT/DnrJ/EryC1/StrS family aminotransferase [Rhizobium sp. K102]|uniref:DegT/DnrJ/EryC1/StrS family aminotransferase n=1 Tax=Rhizobium sp. K102 TaxID=2918527 RepID=UPI001EFA8878|nr:DegT/DnrJ/EryC1/StrS family aminotransferase [Rhizobium sp. K102]ULR43919.1 DegT/DnrJ/EryC1/StrS family aminotransferase [Rhizobium sp. K102]
MSTQSLRQDSSASVRRVPVSQPLLGPEETHHVNAALAQGAISGFFGDYLSTFEQEFAAYCDCAHGVSVSSGTTALHLALATLSIGRGDEVLVASLTNMATFFAVLYQGAHPVPIDSEADTLNLDPALLRAKITSKTKAILVVHLFGHPVDMDPVMQIAREHNLYVIEDCAEAHGALYKGRKVGGIGDIGCFSFYANKVITTGEGGMLTLNNAEWADRARNLKGLAFGDKNKFMHKDIGYNFRMTNLQAAIGHAQFGKIEQIIDAKRSIANKYTQRLRGRDDLQLPVEKPYARNVHWMYMVLVSGRNAGRRAEVMRALAQKGIESRENFLPYNMQEIFIDRGWTSADECPVANDLGLRGFYLPSGPAISDDDIDYVCQSLIEALDQ